MRSDVAAKVISYLNDLLESPAFSERKIERLCGLSDDCSENGIFIGNEASVPSHGLIHHKELRQWFSTASDNDRKQIREWARKESEALLEIELRQMASFQFEIDAQLYPAVTSQLRDELTRKIDQRQLIFPHLEVPALLRQEVDRRRDAASATAQSIFRVLCLVKHKNLSGFFPTQAETIDGLRAISKTPENLPFISALMKLVADLEDKVGPLQALSLYREQYQKVLPDWQSDHDHGENATEKTRLTAPFIRFCQEGVGHGGFHHGILGLKQPLFRWVYDCGAPKKYIRAPLENFKTRIKQSGGQLDLLMISHFDSDHVSGIEQLLDNLKVDTAVIPYFSPINKFMALRALPPQSGQEVTSAILDARQWLRDRGVRRVIQIRSEQSREGPLADPSIRAETSPVGFSAELFDYLGVGQPYEVDTELFSGASIALRGLSNIDWNFFFHAFEWTRNSKLLERQIEAIVGCRTDSANFAEALGIMVATKAGIRSVRESFEKFNLSGNVPTLSVYIGPTRGNSRTGWVLSGDAELANGNIRSQWLAAFSRFSGNIEYVMIPHHGSILNYDDSIISMSKAVKYFVAAKTKIVNGNPSHSTSSYYLVSQDLRARSKSLDIVNDKPLVRSSCSGTNEAEDWLLVDSW